MTSDVGDGGNASVVTAATLKESRQHKTSGNVAGTSTTLQDRGRRPDSSGRGSRNSGRPSGARRQRIGDLVASCVEDICYLEKGAAMEMVASERQARLAQAIHDFPHWQDAVAAAEQSAGARVGAEPAHSRHLGQRQRAPLVEVNVADAASTEPSMTTVPQSSQGGSHPSAAYDASSRPQDQDGCHSQNDANATSSGPNVSRGPQPIPSSETRDSPAEPVDTSAAHSLLEALAKDNTVMECNIRDYDMALRAAMKEVLTLRTDVMQMETACGQLGQLKELLAREAQAHANLREEHWQLADKNNELVSVIREALAADDHDVEHVSLIDTLVSENNALRALLLHAEPAAAAATMSSSASPVSFGAQRSSRSRN